MWPCLLVKSQAYSDPFAGAQRELARNPLEQPQADLVHAQPHPLAAWDFSAARPFAASGCAAGATFPTAFDAGLRHLSAGTSS